MEQGCNLNYYIEYTAHVLYTYTCTHMYKIQLYIIVYGITEYPDLKETDKLDMCIYIFIYMFVSICVWNLGHLLSPSNCFKDFVGLWDARLVCQFVSQRTTVWYWNAIGGAGFSQVQPGQITLDQGVPFPLIHVYVVEAVNHSRSLYRGSLHDICK